MSQTTRRQVSEQVESLRDVEGPPLHEILDARMVEEALAARGSASISRIYTPFVTICIFLSQILDPDHSCRAAVARLIVWMAIHDREPCSQETGTYCDARRRLPLGVVGPWSARPATRSRAAWPSWLWKGRRVPLVDGTTASMPDTPENQTRFPAVRPRASAWGSRWSGWSRSSRWPPGSCATWRSARTRGRRRARRRCSARSGTGSNRARSCWGTAVFASYFGIAGLRDGASTACSGCTSDGSTTSAAVAARGRGSRGDLDQAGAARLDGRGDLCSDTLGLISHLSRSLIFQQHMNIYVSLDTIRDYLYAADCARAFSVQAKNLRRWQWPRRRAFP